MSTSLESFVNVLKRSGLVDEPVIAQRLDAQTDAPPSRTGEHFAEYLVQNDVITAWQAAKLLQGKHKGFFLGKYKLLRLLGKGGMSSVYLAEHVLMRRRCAIKVLPWKLVKDSSYLERFHREAQAVAALDHPNIVRAYDIDHEQDGNFEIHFLVMEYVEGQNLFDLVQSSGPLSAETAADYIRQGALGLAHAHKSGMVHRDVKPGNFIVDQHGTVKLMDLGLARVAASEADHSLTIAHDERVLGTADYLAPEQAVDSHLVDTRADLYSLGCTLYFLLTGRPPFNEGTLTQRLLAHQTREPTPVESLRPDVPASLLEVLRRLMMKDREQRMQTAEEVSAALTQWLRSEAEGAAVAPAARQTTSPPVAAVTTPRAETPARKTNQELGDFLSSLSDVEPSSGKMSGGSGRSGSKSAPRMSKSGPQKVPASPEVSNVPAPPVFPSAGPVFVEPDFPSHSSGSGKSLESHESGSQTRKAKASLKQVLTPERLALLKQYRIPLIAGAALILITGGVLVFGRSLFSSKPTQSAPSVVEGTATETPTPAPKQTARPAVTGDFITVGPQGNFGTLGEAVQHIQDHAFVSGKQAREIRIAGKQTLKESISIDNSGLGSFPRGVKITGDKENPPRLQSTGSGSIFSMNSIDGFTLENVTIECRGLPQAMELRGFMSSITLTRVNFENIQNVAILGIGLGGVGGQMGVLQNCSFTGSSRSAVAIKLDPGPGQDTREINIRNCRFLGPLQTCIAVQGEADNLSFTLNRFHDAATGIAFSGTDPLRKRLSFTNNTFHNCDQGIIFESGPSASDTGFTFQKNLFIGGSGAAVSVQRTETDLAQLIRGGAGAEWNWTDRAELGSGALNIFTAQGKTGAEIKFASTDPAEAAFLKPESDALKAAAASSPAPSFIGAVSP